MSVLPIATLKTNMPIGGQGEITASDLHDLIDTVEARTDGKGQISGELTAPGNRTYTIDLSAPFGYTINSLVTQTTAGTATIAVQIGGVNVTGLNAVATSTTLTTSTATAANTVAANAKVTFVVSAVAGASELAFALRYTRT